ncbi:DNA alkylation repair protein [Nocardioides sp. ChNu-153]|uniref:DNA alkylation repair protein n=1 Tax=Nocardioides sp. ChNu-99 TaxID=2839897 RepID=UPI002405B4F8|nr:DNA alkylation repair protein [Nocardioides sp. ChNu-99]MDF9714919.1 DNA alkylation repair protein [Nocardioides sp. ChNu-99]MDN7123080.1 DNA alkylation repair protein [Nocardioides sp. ChNu-153]
MPATTAAAVLARLEAAATDADLAALRRRLGPDEPAFGLRMGTLFAIARTAAGLSLPEVERLLAHPTFEGRMAGFCVLDEQARRALRADRRGDRALREVYLAHHDAITTWDMVDRAAPRVVGATLLGGPHDLLDDLARSPDPLRRRTAVTAPLWFTRAGTADDLAAGFALAARLHADPEPRVHLPVGIFLAHAGKVAPDELTRFLERYGAAMPRAALRQATRLRRTA